MPEDVSQTGINIAHLSDLHFSTITLSPTQFFSKRWIGNINLLLSRKNKVGAKSLPKLVNLLQELDTHLVLITGDLTSTSHHHEFKKAEAFLSLLKKADMEVVVIPGNHDYYTRHSYKQKRFYDFFPSHLHPEEDALVPSNLKEHAIAVKPLSQHWYLVALDTALATSLVSSRGLFSKILEKRLRRTLSMIPKGCHVIVANHFPFFKQESPRKNLIRGEALMKTLKDFPNVKLYLHGHSHRSSLVDLRESHLPIILDSGSTGLKPRQSWNRIILKDSELAIEQFEASQNTWEAFRTEIFTL